MGWVKESSASFMIRFYRQENSGKHRVIYRGGN